MKENFLNKKNEILNNLSNATLEEVSQILNHYKSSQVLDNGEVNIKPVKIDGVVYHYKYNTQEAASLNARYRELTGYDHPVFLEEQSKVLKLLLRNKTKLAKQGYLKTQVDTLERLRKNLKQNTPAIEVTSGIGNHILNKSSEILMNLQEASLEDVTLLLNYYNGKTVVIDGVTYHPFNDPISAYKLNARYHELTGKDHPNFVKQVPIVIDELIKDKDILLKSGVYQPEYFETLERIRKSFSTELNSKPKQR